MAAGVELSPYRTLFVCVCMWERTFINAGVPQWRWTKNEPTGRKERTGRVGCGGSKAKWQKLLRTFRTCLSKQHRTSSTTAAFVAKSHSLFLSLYVFFMLAFLCFGSVCNHLYLWVTEQGVIFHWEPACTLAKQSQNCQQASANSFRLQDPYALYAFSCAERAC